MCIIHNAHFAPAKFDLFHSRTQHVQYKKLWTHVHSKGNVKIHTNYNIRVKFAHPLTCMMSPTKWWSESFIVTHILKGQKIKCFKRF